MVPVEGEGDGIPAATAPFGAGSGCTEAGTYRVTVDCVTDFGREEEELGTPLLRPRPPPGRPLY